MRVPVSQITNTPVSNDAILEWTNSQTVRYANGTTKIPIMAHTWRCYDASNERMNTEGGGWRGERKREREKWSNKNKIEHAKLNTYSRSKKNGNIFVQTASHRSCWLHHFNSVYTCVQLVSLPMCKKMKRHLVHLPTSIDSLIQPRSSKLFWDNSLPPFFDLSKFCDWGSIEFEVSYRWSINLALPIDSDHLQMRSLR